MINYSAVKEGLLRKKNVVLRTNKLLMDHVKSITWQQNDAISAQLPLQILFNSRKLTIWWAFAPEHRYLIIVMKDEMR